MFADSQSLVYLKRPSTVPSPLQQRIATSQKTDQIILIVEDHPVNQRLTLRQLEKLGWAADVVNNGYEAVEAVIHAKQPYALILMDCQMPVLDGYAATRAIRVIEHDGLRRTPIIAMTANAMQGDREVCLAAGMDDYLSKPVHTADLQRVLDDWLAHNTTLAANQALSPVDTALPRTLDAEMIASLRELESNDTTLFNELVDIFLADTREQIALLHVALTQADMATIEQIAHRLYGSSANMGATTLAKRCAELELLGRMQMTTSASTQLDAIEDEFSRVQLAFHTERQLS